MQGRLEIWGFGGLIARINGAPVTFETQKEGALLVYLAYTGRSHPREVVAEMLWENRTQSQALANLRHVLAQLRQHVAPFVTISRQAMAMNPAREWWLDVADFERQLDAASKQDTENLETALNLYQGDFLAGTYVDSTAFEDWVLREREHLRLRAMGALDTLVVHYMTQGAYAQGIAYANQLLSMDTLRGETYRHLMELLARSGQRGKALAQYETCRTVDLPPITVPESKLDSGY